MAPADRGGMSRRATAPAAPTSDRTTEGRHRGALSALVAISVMGLIVRLVAARTVGFGDSEALYACYALFPQPAYLDHPGLVGMLARALGHGLAPSPEVAHDFTAVATTLAPFAVFVTCRAFHADRRACLAAALATAVAPEIAVGLFGMTPDLLLFFAWLATIAFFGRALLSRPDSAVAAGLFVSAGIALGVACASKVSGLTLGLALLVALRAPACREHLRTLWPWVTLALAAVIFSPIVFFEARRGWPMVHHRLVDTQLDAGLSLRNVFAMVFGQGAYVSPVLAVYGVSLGRELFATRKHDALRALLASATFVPLVILGALCLWSRVAEPHWLAPAWLAIPLFYAHRTSRLRAGLDADMNPADRAFGRRTRVASVVVGLAMSAFVYAWVLIPGLVALVPSRAYDARVDIANELYGWSEVAADVARIVEEERAPLSAPGDIVVVGPVWMVCAQLRAAMEDAASPTSPGIPVGCAGTDVADFVDWYPRKRWSRAEIVVFVHDNRAPVDTASLFPDRTLLATRTRTITRGGHVARVFTIDVLSRRAAG